MFAMATLPTVATNRTHRPSWSANALITLAATSVKSVVPVLCRKNGNQPRPQPKVNANHAIVMNTRKIATMMKKLIRKDCLLILVVTAKVVVFA